MASTIQTVRNGQKNKKQKSVRKLDPRSYYGSATCTKCEKYTRFFQTDQGITCSNCGQGFRSLPVEKKTYMAQVQESIKDLETGWNFADQKIYTAYKTMFNWLSGLHSHDMAFMKKVSDLRLELVAFNAKLEEIIKISKASGLCGPDSETN